MIFIWKWMKSQLIFLLMVNILNMTPDNLKEFPLSCYLFLCDYTSTKCWNLSIEIITRLVGVHCAVDIANVPGDFYKIFLKSTSLKLQRNNPHGFANDIKNRSRMVVAISICNQPNDFESWMKLLIWLTSKTPFLHSDWLQLMFMGMHIANRV